MNFAFNLETETEVSFKAPQLTLQEQLLHEKALAKAKNFKIAHADLLEIVMEVDEARLYEKFLLTSTFGYCMEILNLSRDVTCVLTKVARASVSFPELKEAIVSDEIHMSNARQIGHLLTEVNKSEWIEKAKNLTQEGLQKEIVKQFPKEAVKEKAKYVADKRVKLEVGLDDEVMELLKWAQDFVSQKTKSAASIEATLNEILTEYKDRNDPIKKAERSENRKGKTGSKSSKDRAGSKNSKDRTGSKSSQSSIKITATKELPVARLQEETKPKKYEPRRTTIPAEIIHQVNLRDQRRCQERLPSGKICGQTRWMDYHHIIEVQHGGSNTLENLITLCGFHHRLRHKQ